MTTCSLDFVDSIAANPSVRLALASGPTWIINPDETDFSPPPIREAVAQTLLADGGVVPSAAYDFRRIRLGLFLADDTPDAMAAALQALHRELDRSGGNILRWHQHTTNPVFFRTYRASASSVRHLGRDGTRQRIAVDLRAEPYGYGPKETLPPVVVSNDPANAANGCWFDIDSTTPSNANPYFETDVSNWTPINGPTLTRSTAQFHEGAASMLITPNGVGADPRAQSETLVVSAGQSWFASGWLRSPGTPTVGVTIRWYSDAAGSTFISESGNLSALTADTWTYFSVTGVAPATAIRARIAPRYSGTPAAGTTLFVDEAIIGPSQGIKGDAPTPLFLIAPTGLVVTGRRQSVLSVRRRGTPSATPFALQAETLAVGDDTSLLGPDAAMSGTGSDYARTTFATNATMVTRLNSTTAHPSSASVDARGRYRIFSRHRKSVAGDTIKVRLNIASNGLAV
ncbi:MAG TPA: hypothetical protein VFR23_13780, partial [Jiangellaceae bacterium]|nr:hypothetical protein [Jiangellaceae bacterium]